LYNRVPTTADTVTWLYAIVNVVGGLVAHAMAVADDHDIELHTSAPNAAVDENSYEPKFRPLIVTSVPPLVPPFSATA
jgi:hypothetical protein